MTDLTIRQATAADAAALHALISAHRAEGHLLPRELNELARHAGRFVVCDVDGDITACAELAPLSSRSAEVRRSSPKDFRRVARGALVSALTKAARHQYEIVCAFTHDVRPFVRQNFRSCRTWLPEKITTDARRPLFKRGQHHGAAPREQSRAAAALDGRVGLARGRRCRLTGPVTDRSKAATTPRDSGRVSRVDQEEEGR